MENLVSIIIPTYNTCEEMLNHCIQSITNQVYEDYEIILIDDGSKADIAHKIDEKFGMNNKIKIIHQNNKGVSASRNLGIKLSKGRYVTFVDADDCIDCNWLSVSVEVANKENADVVYGVVKRINDYSQCNRSHSKNINEYRYMTYDKESLWKLQNLLLTNNNTPIENMEYLDIGAYGKLYRRSVIQDVEFPEDLYLAEDQVFNHRALNCCNCCCICASVSYYYFVENNFSVSHKYTKDAVDTMVKAMLYIRNCLINLDYSSNEYDYCFLYNVIVASSMQIFRKQSPYNNLISKYLALRTVKNNIYIREVLAQVRLKHIPFSNTVLKVFFLKYNSFILASYISLRQLLRLLFN